MGMWCIYYCEERGLVSQSINPSASGRRRLQQVKMALELSRKREREGGIKGKKEDRKAEEGNRERVVRIRVSSVYKGDRCSRTRRRRGDETGADAVMVKVGTP